MEYNLIREPWISCLDNRGKVLEMGLEEILLKAHTLGDISAETPLVRASLYRLLLAILHRNFGPKGSRQWSELREQGKFAPEVLKNYFTENLGNFDLFHKTNPFFQDASLRTKPYPVHRFAFIFENNASLFDHSLDTEPKPYTPARAARFLLAFNNYEIAGLGGFKDATCTKGIQFFIIGENLFETLMLNLIRYGGNFPGYHPSLREDLPRWEKKSKRKIPGGYVEYLTWENRKIKLIPREIGGTVVIQEVFYEQGQALDLLKIFDPFKLYTESKQKNRIPLGFNENKALWRDSHVIYGRNTEAVEKPHNLLWIEELMSDEYIEDKGRILMALGMRNDQKKVLFFKEEILPLTRELLEDPEVGERIDEALKLGEELYSKLKITVSIICNELDITKEDRKKFLAKYDPSLYYWPSLEIPFKSFLHKVGSGTGAMDEWSRILKEAAENAFVFSFNDFRRDVKKLKAFVKGRGYLMSQIKLLSNEKGG